MDRINDGIAAVRDIAAGLHRDRRDVDELYATLMNELDGLRADASSVRADIQFLIRLAP
jgi:hypothetical protein